MKIFKPISKAFNFYFNGFKNMPKWGKHLWIIILVKIFVFFVVMKILFFPNFLKSKYDNDESRSNHVLEELTKTK